MHPLKPFVAALGCYALILSQAGCASPAPEQGLAPSLSQTAPARALSPAEEAPLGEPSRAGVLAAPTESGAEPVDETDTAPLTEPPTGDPLPAAFPAGPYLLPTDPVDLAQIKDGLITAPEYAVSVLQLLFDHEYQAFVELDPTQLDSSSTFGWEFSNADYEFLSELGDSGAHGVGYAPAEILSVAQISNLPNGDWDLTVLTSELGIEIKDAQGVPLLDTRGDGPTMATYTISFAAK